MPPLAPVTSAVFPSKLVMAGGPLHDEQCARAARLRLVEVHLVAAKPA
jgi:hypothetical protein